MPRPWITQGPVTAKAGIADAIVGTVKLRGGRVGKINFDGYPAGWMVENRETHVKEPAKFNYYLLHVTATRGGGAVEYRIDEEEATGLEFMREAKLDELFDRFVVWLDKVMPPPGLGLWAQFKTIFRRII